VNAPTSEVNSRLIWGPPLIVALLAGGFVLISLDPAGDYPAALAGPGVTIDESLNVNLGLRLTYGVTGFLRGTYSLQDVFGEHEDLGRRKTPLGAYRPDYPPLGRFWLGASHEAVRATVPPENTQARIVIAAARAGSAVAFALTIFLVGFAASRWYGWSGGLFASLSLATMPRVFGHAHIASLETVTGLVYAATVFSVAGFWREKPPSWRAAALTGGLFGLALLTKLQAVFLPIPIALWALMRYRLRALMPLCVWGGVACAVFFAGWPWLWLDPLQHPIEYIRQTTDRISLNVFYVGTKYADRNVPWHYPFVLFLTTVPVGWQLAGFWGVKPRNADAAEQWRTGLLAASILFPLLVFAIPGTVVYDGARLFLIVFPVWAVFVGRGMSAVFSWLRERWSRRTVVLAVTLFTMLQAVPLWQMRPCYLSYYNALIGGTWGAEKLGMETDYWGGSVHREFLGQVSEAVPKGATIDVIPVMHQLQVPTLQSQCPALQRRNITLRAYDPQDNGPSRYVLVFRRRADLPPRFQRPPENARILAEVRRQNVLLAALYELRE